MRLKKYVTILILLVFASCGISDAVDSINCLADHNDPALLTAYSDALIALTNDPENQVLCQEFKVALDNYRIERIAYAECLRDNVFTSGKDLEEIEQEIANLQAERDELPC